MTPNEVAIVAAFGASLLTGGASLGVVWFQDWRRARSDDDDALHAAALELMTRSMSFGHRAEAMGQAMRLRSGLKEGLEVVLRLRKPADPLELHDWMVQDLTPLNDALAKLWARADQEGIRLANDVVGRCVDLMGTSLATRPVHNRRGRLRKLVVGESWTPEMQAAHDQAMKDLAAARKRFAEYARRSLGRRAVDVFAQVDPAPGAAALPAAAAEPPGELPSP